MESQQDALYRAVCDYPDEDTPRLIFADFVEEAGDAIRAALIRTQIELARVPEHHALWSRCRQSNPNAILGWSLTYPLPELPYGFTWEGHRVRRGFSWQTMALDADALDQKGKSLFDAAPIQSLKFDDRCQLHKRMACLAESSHLARIRRLEFTLSRLGPDDVRTLAESPFASNITEMAFTNHAITAEGLIALAESRLLAQLTDFTLEQPALPAAAIVDALAAAQPGMLRHLSIADWSLSAIDVVRLASLPVLQSLEALDLSGNALRGDGLLALASSRLLLNLEVLKLARTFAGLAGMQRLVESTDLVSLRWLDLSSNRLGPAAVRTLANSDLANGLHILDLSNNPIGDAGAIAIAEGCFQRIHELVLRNCSIGDRGAIALARSPVLNHLVRFDLRDATLSHDVQKALRERLGNSVTITSSPVPAPCLPFAGSRRTSARRFF